MVKTMEMNKNVKDIFAKANAIREKAKLDMPKENTRIIETVPVQDNSPARYVGVTGIQIREDGTITKANYLKNLEIDTTLYQNMNFTEEEVKALTYSMKRQSSGINSAVPIRCTGDTCPFKASCEPDGALVLTSDHGYIPIEHLNSEVHRLVSFRTKHQLILGKNNGYSFKKYTTWYDGTLISINTVNGFSHNVTPNHISIVKWAEEAEYAFCVYLMQKGNRFRIGKTKLISNTKSQGYEFGPQQRLANERADKVWVIGTYKTNTMALLAEEYFSCKWGIPKALFIATNKNNTKYDGMYKWITQEELDAHHDSMIKDVEYIKNCLISVNKYYDAPIATRNIFADHNISRRISTGQFFTLRACNLISEYMKVVTFNNETLVKEFSNIEIKYKTYSGNIHSLDVEKYNMYISSGIITHNCPYMAIGKPPLMKPCLVESQLIHYWTEQYIDEFNVDPANITELHMVSELAEFNVYEMRVTKYLAENHPTLLQDIVVGVDANGNVIENQDVSKAFELKDRIKKNRMKVLEALMATRKERLKVVSEVIGGGNTMTKLSELKAKMAELSSQVKTMKAVDADFREIK